MLFGALLNSSYSKSFGEIEVQERANIHYLYLYYLKYGKIDVDYLKSQNIKVVDIGGKDVKLYKKVCRSGNDDKFSIVNINLHRYILINNDRFKLVLENLNHPRFPIELIIAFGGATGLLVLLYIWIIKSIIPLSKLRDKIIKFSRGDLSIRCRSSQKDEIGEVTNAFDMAVQTIRDLLKSRQLLLRAIMHELKTPIAKGRLMAEMIAEPKKRDRFHRVFERLNLLIDEFAKVEKVTSKSFQPNFKKYKISDILEGSIDILMLDNPQKYIQTTIIKDRVLETDFELMSLALKNLIDNGIKYSPDHTVNISLKSRHIEISNIGKKLKGDIEEYFTPFHSSEGGLGLGLYIVKSILDIHSFKLDYSYERGVNSFKIYFHF
jgi:two-component system OmpR family sensor kinase